ncbi:MAG: hypothetical protein ACUVQP_04495, partial [Bacteroidales bacterium]
MNNILTYFRVYYMLHKRHGALTRELNVKTYYQPIEKWFEINSQIFKQNLLQIKNKGFYLHKMIPVFINKLVKREIKSYLILGMFLLLSLGSYAQQSNEQANAMLAKIDRQFFIENKGQWP